MDKIIFANDEHRELFYKALGKCRRINEEVIPLMYCLSLAAEGRWQRITQLFDFTQMHIKPDNFNQPWQTSGTEAAVRLGFCLWNGFPSEENQQLNNVYNIFFHGYTKYLVTAIKLRFPSSYPEITKSLLDYISNKKEIIT